MVIGKYLPLFINFLKTRTKIFDINIYNKPIDKVMYKISNNLLTNYILNMNDKALILVFTSTPIKNICFKNVRFGPL